MGFTHGYNLFCWAKKHELYLQSSVVSFYRGMLEDPSNTKLCVI